MKNKEINQLLKKYTGIIEQLQKAGVIRSSKVVSDYGEYISSKKLNLELMKSSINKGYDAVDKEGKKYEIKSRKSTSYNKATIIPVPNNEQMKIADFLVFIRFNNDWDIDAFLRIPMPKAKEMIDKYNRIGITKRLIDEFSI